MIRMIRLIPLATDAARAISGLASIVACSAVMISPPFPIGATTVPHAGRPVILPPAGSLVVAVPLSRDTSAATVPVRLIARLDDGRVFPLYHALPTSDVAVSPDGRLLAYGDAGHMVHLVNLARGTDRVIGRGVSPRFSFDGRDLAYVTGPVLPVATPGIQGTDLEIYDTRRGVLSHVGPRHAGPLTGFTWAPRDRRLTWRINGDASALRVGLADADHPSSARILTLPTSADAAGDVAWSPDGGRLLYWRFTASRTVRGVPVPLFALTGWRLPNGPRTDALSPVQTAWTEGIAPAPVPNPSGTTVASLLGEPVGHIDQVSLYTDGRTTPRRITLPGEPRLVRYNADGTCFVTVWTPAYGRGTLSHAALVRTDTGSVRDLGPAMAAFWVQTP